jgi:hypothetical protein
MHVGAAICFAIAMALYLASWMPGAIALGMLGVCFELAAWVQLFADSDGAKKKR